MDFLFNRGLSRKPVSIQLLLLQFCLKCISLLPGFPKCTIMTIIESLCERSVLWGVGVHRWKCQSSNCNHLSGSRACGIGCALCNGPHSLSSTATSLCLPSHPGLALKWHQPFFGCGNRGPPVEDLPQVTLWLVEGLDLIQLVASWPKFKSWLSLANWKSIKRHEPRFLHL